MMKPNADSARKMWEQALTFIETDDPEALEWARSVGEETFSSLDYKDFLREYCYVVYASGFKAATIQGIFPRLAKAFKDFDPRRLSGMTSISGPLAVFASERKATCFMRGVQEINNEGFENFKQRLKSEGYDALGALPGLGPITKFHLAKNIGLADVAKPDIWLKRAAQKCGCHSVNQFVRLIEGESGQSRHIIDVVIWHFGRKGKMN